MVSQLNEVAITIEGALRACCSGVEIREPQPLICDLVDVGRADLAAEAAHVGEAQVIGNDDEEVRSFTHGESRFFERKRN